MSIIPIRLLCCFVAFHFAIRFLSAETPAAYATAQAWPRLDQNTTGFGAVSGAFKPGAGEHISRAADRATDVEHSEQQALASEGSASPATIVATRSSFAARWSPINGATSYRLDVSTSSSFDGYVRGYQGLEVGAATWRVVTGLSPGTTYYYRVTGLTEAGFATNSDVMTGQTATGSGFVISPTFDSSLQLTRESIRSSGPLFRQT